VEFTTEEEEEDAGCLPEFLISWSRKRWMGGQTAYPNDLLGESRETWWWLTGDDLLTSQVTDDETRARQVVSSAAPAPAESLLRMGKLRNCPLQLHLMAHGVWGISWGLCWLWI